MPPQWSSEVLFAKQDIAQRGQPPVALFHRLRAPAAGVVEETLAAFKTQLSLGFLLTQKRLGLFIVGQVREQVFGNTAEDIQAAQVSGLKGTDAVLTHV